MPYITLTQYKRRESIVRLHDSDGHVSEHPVEDFDNPTKQAQILAAYDAPPAQEKSAEQEVAQLKADYAALNAKVAALEAKP